MLLSFLMAALFLFSSIACQLNVSLGDQDVLNLWDTGPITLDPAIVSDQSSHIYIVQIFSGLVRLDDEMKVAPDIAESWELSQDGRTYTFHLRPGVKFHDGREVKAEDFKYSLERVCDPDTGSRTATTYLGDIVGVSEVLEGKAEEISGVRVVDDYTLEISIDAPKAYFLRKLTYPTGFIVDRYNVESGAGWWREPNGTGPLEMQEWSEGQWFTLLPSQDYYGEPAKLRQVVFHLLSGVPMSLYERGEIDIAPVNTNYIDLVTDETGPFSGELAVSPELSFFCIGFNTAEPPFDDVNVRRAFCHAVDKEKIVKVIFRDIVNQADGILPQGMPGYNEDLKGLDYDVAKAKELIAASKYGDTENMPAITLTVSGYGNNIPSYLGAIIEGWQQDLGVEVTVRQLETENFLYNLEDEKDEMFVLGWVADYPDPHNFLDNLFYTGSENNAFGYSNPEVDALLDKAAVEQDDFARMALYQQAEQMIVDEAACLPLWFGTNYILVKPYVKDYKLSPLGIPDLSQVYLE